MSLEQAQAEMDEIATTLRATYPDHERSGSHLDVRPLHQEIVGYVRQTLHALLGGVGLVLLIACANVGCLTLVRARGLALGALGIGIGTIAALPLRRVLTGLLFGVHPSDLWTQVATVAVLFAAAAFGSLGPALRSVRVDPAETLRAE